MTRANPHILYLSYDGLTDPLGQSQILPYIIGLSKMGYNFTIVSFEKPERFEKSKETIKQLCDKHNIKWTPLTYHKKPPVVSTLFDIWSLWQNTNKIHKVNPIHIVHCRSYITSLVGSRAKKKLGVKFIFDMRGFWADERVEGGLWNLRNPLYKMVYSFFKKKEREFLIEADHIVSLTYNAQKEIESWGIQNAPITIIPTCVDLELFDPEKIKKEDQDLLRSKLGINETDFLLLYLGSWGTWYLTDDMLDFFATLKKKKTNAKLLIVSADKIDIKNYPHEKNVIITAAPRGQVPLHISLAQASIFFLRPTFSKKASSATKMGEIMAMRLPIVVNTGWGDVERDLSANKNGFMIQELSSLSYDNAVDWLLKFVPSPDTESIAYLRLDKGIETYERIYSSI